jgi:DNA repair protein RecN (Recombination protein N)
MNPGEPLQPLHKVASGGELSRLMLGLKTIFTSLQGVELVIFDEIDSGVSGAVATSIGQKMLEISKKSQVFAVTHLAQVAACANQQYSVSKKQTEESTTSSICLLDEESRIQQLALIASGSLTDASIQAAKELLQRNQ